MRIPLSGPKKSGTLFVAARAAAGQWQFERAEVEVDGDAARIDLLAGKKNQ